MLGALAAKERKETQRKLLPVHYVHNVHLVYVLGESKPPPARHKKDRKREGSGQVDVVTLDDFRKTFTVHHLQES